MVYRTFPFRLYSILEDSAKDEEESNVISWTPDGETFKIHDLDAFKERILPKYLPKQSKYKSFKRQLQYYGFTNHGSNTYGHHSFLRDEKSLLSQIEHRAFKKTKIRTEPSKPMLNSNSATQEANADKASEGDAEKATSSLAPDTSKLSATSPASTASLPLINRDTLRSLAFAPPSMVPGQTDLHSHLLMSLTGGLPSQGLASSLPMSLPPRQTDEAALLSSLSQSSLPPKGETSTNGLLSTLFASQLQPSASSLASSPSALLALELEFQRQRQQQQEAQDAAIRAQLMLSLATNPTTQPNVMVQQQQRRESLERLALLNGLGALQQYEV